MNQERPTPETDAVVRRIAESGHYSAAILDVVDADVSRRIERERNEAREELADYKSSVERTNKLISDTVEKVIRERDEARELARELRDALEAISTNPHLNLEDKIYDVRDREGEGWNGPSVTAWNNACRKVDLALTKCKEMMP